MAATIRDIKEKTGLSLATISKYINGGHVLPENKEKIEAAIKELHYEVNEIARGLVTNKTKTIGIVVFRIESLFNGTLLHYIGNVLREKGYGLLICDSCDDEQIEADNVKFLIGKKVDGIIAIPVSDHFAFWESARQRNIPVVLIDRSIEDAACDCVKIDNRNVARQAVEYLIAKHHEKIAVICSGKEYTGIERYKGFMDAMDEAGYKVPESYYKPGVHSVEHGYDSMKALLDLEDRPTAVFMTNYEITLGAVMALQESEYSCPKDISVLGFDNLLLTHLVEPKMSMVVQPMQELAEKAAEIILQRIEGKAEEKPIEIVLNTQMAEGDSVRDLKEN